MVKRAKFSVVQHREIRQAWSNLTALDMRSAEAVDARSELDLRIGAVFTRFQTVNIKSRFEELLDKKVLSYGPCQFPTLGFIVDRYLRAKNFKEEPFWKIEVTLEKEGVNSNFTWNRGHLFDQGAVQAIFESLKEDPRAKITKVTSKPTSKWAPLPLTTVELQKLGSRFLKMSSDRIMAVAENLYNQGIISYPRTETDVFADSFQLQPLIEKQVEDQNWGTYAQGLLNGNFRKPRKGKHDDQAHPPIHPVRAAHNLHGEEKKLFEFVTRRFLACCSAAAKGNETIVDMTMGSEKFKASGLTILERNFLDVYPYEKWSDSIIAPFRERDVLQPKTLKVVNGSTSKPQMLTEADLITLMDQSGIGTDATIHEHIKKVLEREYATKEGNFFYPTTLGMALVSGYDRMDIDLSLSKPDLRSLMEQNMKSICMGQKSKAEVVEQVCNLYRSAFEIAKNQLPVMMDSCAELLKPVPLDQVSNDAGSHGDFVRHCPSCPSQMFLKQIRRNEERKMIGCAGYPSCKESKWFPHSVSSVSVEPETCSRCSAPSRPVHKISICSTDSHLNGIRCLWCELSEIERGSPSTLTLNLGNGKQNSATMNDENVPYCKCNQMAIIRTVKKEGPNQGKQFYSCAKPNGCDYFDWADGTPPRSTNFSMSAGSVNCDCNIPAVLRVVKKEGPNCGKEFFSCSKSQSDSTKCGFFQWADSGPSDMSAYRTTTTAPDNEKKCNCNLVAIQRMSSKEDSKGRSFYTCPKSSARCNFFEWTDAPGSRPMGSTGNTCYKCGTSGHFANSCPNGSNSKSSSASSSRGTGNRRGRGGGRGSRGKRKPKNSLAMTL
jgi:DNA topoisomerase-3